MRKDIRYVDSNIFIPYLVRDEKRKDLAKNREVALKLSLMGVNNKLVKQLLLQIIRKKLKEFS